MVIAAIISDRLHLKWWICFSVTVSRVLAKCTGSSSVLNKNCKFEHRSTDLHTNTLWHLLNHLFAAFNHFKQLFWSSFSNVCRHTLHGSLRFCVCLEISTFGVSTCTRPIYTLIFSHLGHAFGRLKHLFWFSLSKVQAINRAGYVFHEKLIIMHSSHLRVLPGEIKWEKWLNYLYWLLIKRYYACVVEKQCLCCISLRVKVHHFPRGQDFPQAVYILWFWRASTIQHIFWNNEVKYQLATVLPHCEAQSSLINTP